MKKTTTLTFSSFENLIEKIDLIAAEFRESSVICIRGLKLNKDDQLEVTKKLGDIFSWSPSNSSEFFHQYTENHSGMGSRSSEFKSDEIIVDWHIEHPDYDKYTPLVAGIWNMQKFLCNSNSGMTYFMDSREVYKKLFTDNEKEFLKKCEASWMEEYFGGEKFENTAKVISNHWLDGRETVRIEMHQLDSYKLHKFEENNPTEEQQELFQSLVSKFVDEIHRNTELRIVQEWQEGDIVIPDLYSMVHAVTGGFRPEEREFTGYWCYLWADQDKEQNNVHPSWRN